MKSENLEGDENGFKLSFFFKEDNPHIKNKVLTKTYYMVDSEDPILEKVVTTRCFFMCSECTDKVSSI